jgi:hypothetical protein
MPLSHFFGCLQYPEIIISLRQTLFWKQPEVIWSQTRGIQCVFNVSNRFLGQNLLLEREHLVSWSTVMVENPIAGPKFRPLSNHSFM